MTTSSKALRVVTIQREPSKDFGTFGLLTVADSKFACFTLEMPWRDNKTGISSVPAGTYEVHKTMSPRFKKLLYRLKDVPGRAGILIHAGNTAGDRSKGLKSDVEGCILLGLSRGVLGGQQAILESVKALNAFYKEMQDQDFCLVIKDA